MSTKKGSKLREMRSFLRKPGVVIDKSFLHTLWSADVQRLDGTHLLLMGETLLYEVSKDEGRRARLCKNLKTYSTDLAYLDHYHVSINYELKHAHKSPHPAHFFRDREYQRIDLMAEGAFDDVSAIVSGRKDLIDRTTRGLISLARNFIEIYPQAFTGNNANANVEREKLEKRVADDVDFVRSYLRKNASVAVGEKRESLRKIAAKATNKWAHFIVTQVLLLLAIDIAHRRNLDEPIADNSFEKIRHDVLDSQILISAILVGAIATKDKKITQWWMLLTGKTVDFAHVD